MASYSFPNGLLSRLVSEMAAAVSFSGFLRQSSCSACGLNRLPSRRCTRSARLACSLKRQMLPANCSFNGPPDSDGMRVFVVSDLHTEYEENMEWVTRLSSVWYKKDLLIVAGDVAETYDNFVVTMSELAERFHSIFYVPGNHDLWLRREGGKFIDSLEKLNSLLEACSELGVQTSPKIMGNVGIIPLFSWYHTSFDKEKDVNGIRIPSLKMVSKDFRSCKWPSGLVNGDIALAHFFDSMNEKNQNLIEEIQRNSFHWITFSHFLPRQELCPEKRMLFYPNLPKIIGSDFLEARIRSIHGQEASGSGCHVFGHTHFSWDSVIDGIRYVQASLAYPRERSARKRRMDSADDYWLPFCIYHNGFTDRLAPSYWSDYYSKNKRDPENTDLAPWVARFYRR